MLALVEGLVFRVLGLGFGVYWCRVWGLGFGFQGVGLRVLGFGFWIWGFKLRFSVFTF